LALAQELHASTSALAIILGLYFLPMCCGFREKMFESSVAGFGLGQEGHADHSHWLCAPMSMLGFPSQALCFPLYHFP